MSRLLFRVLFRTRNKPTLANTASIVTTLLHCRTEFSGSQWNDCFSITYCYLAETEYLFFYHEGKITFCWLNEVCRWELLAIKFFVSDGFPFCWCRLREGVDWIYWSVKFIDIFYGNERPLKKKDIEHELSLYDMGNSVQALKMLVTGINPELPSGPLTTFPWPPSWVPRDYKLLFLRGKTRFQTHELEAQPTKFYCLWPTQAAAW